MLYFLIARLSSSLPCRARTHLGFLHHNASHIVYLFSSVVKSSESNQLRRNQEGNDLFTDSYLTPAKSAIKVGKRVKLKDSDKRKLLFDFFKSYGFSDTQISNIVKRCPKVLWANPEKNIVPKLRFIHSIGFSSSELPHLLASNSIFLQWGLKRRIIPLYEALKSVLVEDWKVNILLKRSRWTSVYKYDVKNLVPNIKVLRDLGVPQSSVFLLLKISPRAAFMNHAMFVEYVNFAKQIGIQPFKTIFVQAIRVFAQLKQPAWESKLDMFEKCGWSRDVTLSAFCKFPCCMLASEEKVTKLMKFIVDEMGFPLEDLAGCPTLFSYSLEQRIIPRWSIVKILKMKGLIKKNLSMTYIIIVSEKKFLEKFVNPFQKSVPDLLELYRAQSTAPINQ